MPWIGVNCDVGAGGLERWAAHLEASGGGDVAAFLRSCAGILAGASCGANAADRLRQVEQRAAARLDCIRAKAEADVRAVIAAGAAEGADSAAIAGALGLGGFRAGQAPFCGKRIMNGGLSNKARAAAEKPKGGPGVTRRIALRDARYAATWGAWAACELRRLGFKMKAVADALGMSVGDCWRHASAYDRHWRRKCAEGMAPPPPPEGWAERLDEAVAKATGEGRRGPRAVRNGGGL